ncbi:MAG: hypothetical protein M3O09_12560 [Acidobacteriota bacterium]|nr:hypothetical protein [Acidobacteriota bacterium]
MALLILLSGNTPLRCGFVRIYAPSLTAKPGQPFCRVTKQNARRIGAEQQSAVTQFAPDHQTVFVGIAKSDNGASLCGRG